MESSLCSIAWAKSFGNIFIELLSDKGEKRPLLSDGQFGKREKWSAIHTAAITVDRVHTAWKNGIITGVFVMDIKAVFPSVVRGILIHAMMAQKIDRDLT